MSKNSKAKRDAKRKKHPKTGLRNKVEAPIQSHGEMTNGEGRILLSIGKQEVDWVVMMEGQVVAAASNAADIMVLLHQFADDARQEGSAIFNAYSADFKQAAQKHAEAEGLTLDEYIKREWQDQQETHVERGNESATSEGVA